ETYGARHLGFNDRHADQRRVAFTRHRQARYGSDPEPRLDEADQCRHMTRLEARLRPLARRCEREIHHETIAARLVDGHEVVTRKLSPRYGALARERVVTETRCDERLAQQWLELDRRLVASGHVEAKLRLAMRHRGKHLVRALVDDVHTNSRKAFVVLPKHGRQEVMHGGGDARECHLSPAIGRYVAYTEQDRVQVVQEATGLACEVPPDRGELDVSGIAVEKAHAERVLQLVDAPAQRGLRKVDRLRAGAEPRDIAD